MTIFSYFHLNILHKNINLLIYCFGLAFFKKALMSIVVYADTREGKGANPFFNKYVSANNKKYIKKASTVGGGVEIKVVKKMMTTADYNIVLYPEDKDPIIAVAIERKTWKDLIASIKGSRSVGQTKKMYSLQKDHGCKLYYIIEGNFTFSKRTKIGGKHGMIFEDLYGKLLRDSLKGISFIQTKNQDHTADVITELARNAWRLYQNGELVGCTPSTSDNSKNKSKHESTDNSKKSKNKHKNNGVSKEKLPRSSTMVSTDEDEDVLEDAKDIQEELIKDFGNEETDLETLANLRIIKGSKEEVVPLVLTQKIEVDDADVITEMWTAINNVSNQSAAILMEHYKISDIICTKPDKVKRLTTEIAELKYPSGVKIGEKRAKKITEVAYGGTDPVKLAKAKQVGIKILSKINGVSKDAAMLIMNTYSLREICSGEVTEKKLADIKRKNNRRIGDKLAQRIIKLLNSNIKKSDKKSSNKKNSNKNTKENLKKKVKK